jgi:pimeloyl-ACP methyl ester carboxylesterase
MANFRCRICLFSILLWAQSLPLVADEPIAPAITESLKRGAFATYHFVPSGTPRALVLFGSGDGGWGYFENRACAFLRDHGYYVIGIDCRNYAASDYSEEVLAADFRVIAEEGAKRIGISDLPVIYGGWSMGAVQAVAASGFDRKASHLAGLLLLSMDSRGRYGLRLTDEINIAPTGNGTFGVSDFTDAVRDLRVVQFEAAGDWMDSSDWIKSLKTPHRLYEIKDSNHDFNGVAEDFEVQLLDGLNWILDPSKPPGDDLQRTG